MCAQIGCAHWVVHPLMPYGLSDCFAPESFLEINYEFFTRLLTCARGSGVSICLENMPFTKIALSSPRQILDFIKTMNDPSLGFCLDTGHAAVWGIQPAQALREAGSFLRVMHVHDNDGVHDQHRIPGMGVTQWQAFRQALQDIHFDGVFSLECNWSEFFPGLSVDARLRAVRAALPELLP